MEPVTSGIMLSLAIALVFFIIIVTLLLLHATGWVTMDTNTNKFMKQ